MLNHEQHDQLRNEIKVLHELLAEAEHVDDSTLSALRDVSTDIERLAAADTPERWTQLRERWHAAIVEFESTHPRLAEAVTAITGTLANLGI